MMIIRNQKFYDSDHKIAKAILYSIIVGLILIPVHSPMKEILIVTLWFWALNPIAYIVESIRNHPHIHKKL